MKRVLLLLLLSSIHLFSDEAFVEIYKTHDDGLYGLSKSRDIVLSIKESVFKILVKQMVPGRIPGRNPLPPLAAKRLDHFFLVS